MVIGSRMKRFLWALVLTFLVVFGLRTFVGDVYRVSSSSMEPALFPDEWVFLRYDRSLPDHGELVVVRDGKDSVVKRLVGLPVDSVRIDNVGDVLINNAYRPVETRPEPVLLYDSQRQPIAKYFSHGGTKGDPWVDHGDVWELDAREVQAGTALGMMYYHPQLLDARFDRGGTYIPGTYPVSDAALELEFQATEPGGLLRLQLIEQGDTFEVAIELEGTGEGGLVAATLKRTTVEGDTDLDCTEIPYSPGQWSTLRFENIDNTLRLFHDGELAMSVSYASNTYQALDLYEEGKSWGPRVVFGGEGCRLHVRGVRIWRDQHYTRRSMRDFGGERACELSTDEIFILGDNSSESLDSRERGPYKVRQVLGRPVWVVWPPSAIRKL